LDAIDEDAASRARSTISFNEQDYPSG